ncbi:PAS domain S-box protein [Dyella sedimenti]|uniref:PAS domain S-box protein n=1 Tax=Dyella sedimenti TaxID=2919947 RepID=UPI001FAB0416|nr:PAS domain S-box protein [Dyella sedimenti]
MTNETSPLRLEAIGEGLTRASPETVEHRFRLLVQSVVDYAIYMLDPDGYINLWSSGAQQIKGYASEEVLGRHFSMFYTEEDRRRGMPERALSIARSEGRYNDEAWRVRRDGTRFRALVAIDAIRDDDGRLIGFAKVTRDITKRWEALSRLEASERRFRLFAEGALEYAICMLDAEGGILDWNDGAQRMLGYAGDDVLGKPVACLFHEGDQAAGIPAGMLRKASEQGSCEDERHLPRKHGERFLARITMRALRDKNGMLHGFAYLIRDVSEQRATEDALEATREQLLQAQKLDALGRLTGGVAHDFNNILQAIYGSLDVATLQLQRGDTAKAEHHVESAMRSVDRARHLTQRLLAFARRQPLIPQPLDLNRHVAAMADLLERTVGSRVSVRIDLAPMPLWILCDVTQLETALLNLAINGRDAMPNGGCLRISTSGGVGRGTEAQEIRLTVEDDGIGMSHDMVARAFEPFFTTKPQGQGTGLGLSMIQGFMQQLRGKVTLHSVPGEGTRVVLHFQACRPPAA